MEVDEDYLVQPKEEKFDFDEFDNFQEEEKLPPKRGRTRSLTKKPADKQDIKAKLERSRQSARECRARKKLRYQYLEEIISETEKSIYALRRELDMLKICAKEIDDAGGGQMPDLVMEYRFSCDEKRKNNTAENTKRHEDLILRQQQRFIKQQQQQQQLAASLSPSSSLGHASYLIGTPPLSGLSLSTSPSGSLMNNSFMAMALQGQNSPGNQNSFLMQQPQILRTSPQQQHSSFSPT